MHGSIGVCMPTLIWLEGVHCAQLGACLTKQKGRESLPLCSCAPVLLSFIVIYKYVIICKFRT